MARKPTVVVVMDGGVIQGILTDGDVDATDVIVVDYDVEGAGLDYLVAQVPQDDTSLAPAAVSLHTPDQCSPSWVDEVRHAMDNTVPLGSLDD